MTYIGDIRKVKAVEALAVFGLFLGLLAPGFSTLFLFLPDLILQLDVFKLVLFSASITSPVIGAAFIVEHYSGNKDTAAAFAASVLIAAIVVFVALFIAYGFQLSFRSFLWCVLGLLAIGGWCRYRSSRSEK